MDFETNDAYSKEIAKYYDRIIEKGYLKPKDFIAALKKMPTLEHKQLLELGIGTGFLAIQIAREMNYQVHGIDKSDHMLSRLKKKLPSETDIDIIPYEKRDIFEQNWGLNGHQFPLIISHSGPFFFIRRDKEQFLFETYLTSPDKYRCNLLFSNICKHLVKGGILAVNIQLEHKSEDNIRINNKAEYSYETKFLSDDHLKIQKTHCITTFHKEKKPARQIFTKSRFHLDEVNKIAYKNGLSEFNKISIEDNEIAFFAQKL